MARTFAMLLAMLALGATPARVGVRATFLHPLADGVSRLAFGWSPLSWDAKASELYVVDNRHGVVEVFNDNGMAVHSFGDSALGLVAGVAVLETGEPLLLTVRGESFALVRCNYRGEQVGRIELRGVPAKFAEGFRPGSLHVAAGRVWLADKSSMKVLVVEPDGSFAAAHDLARLAGVDEQRRGDAMMRSFAVEADGHMLFTVATLFRAFVVSPDGHVRSFGVKGSTPGRFNVVGGIASDGDGHLFLTDTLRSVVMVFDRESFRFLGEFASRGRGPSGLVNPLDLVVGNGRVYVTQSTGPVKAFAVQFE